MNLEPAHQDKLLALCLNPLTAPCTYGNQNAFVSVGHAPAGRYYYCVHRQAQQSSVQIGHGVLTFNNEGFRLIADLEEAFKENDITADPQLFESLNELSSLEH